MYFRVIFVTKSMTEGKPLKLILQFAVPLLLGNLLQQMYNLVDAAIVGRVLGTGALAAVGATSSVQFLVLGFCIGICIGFGIPIAKSFGAERLDKMRSYIFNSVLLTALFAVLITAVCSLCCTLILQMLSVPQDVFDDAYAYLIVIFLGIPFTLLYNLLSSILRSVGDSRTPFLFLAISTVLNIGLDLLCIIVFKWGVAGAAIATVISQIASCVIGFAYMHRKYTLLRFSLRELRLDVKTAGRILQVGAPMAIQQSIVSCGFLFLQRLVNLYGESMIAAYTVATRMENILMIPILGVQNTMATFAGQNMGAQRPDRVSRGLGQGVLVSLSMTLVLCLCQILGISRIIRAFQLDEAAAAICRLHLFSSAVAIPIFAVYFPANGMCQGVGEGFHATFFALLALGLRVIFAYALHNTALFGYTAVWWSQAMAWTVTLLVCYAHVFRGKWKTKSLIS